MISPSRVGIAVAVATAASLANAPVARAQGEQMWRTVSVSRQLRDSLPKRIRVQYGAGRVDLRGSRDPLLYDMQLRYDERRAAPLHRYDAGQHSALLGLEERGRGFSGSSSGDEGGELRLALPSSVPLDLDLEFGGTRAHLDLGGLMLQSLRLECGATEATLVFSAPNRSHLRELEIDVGAAGFKGLQLANANADRIRLRGGVGGVDLDFSGTWTRDLNVTSRLAIGALTLRIPSDVGVRLEVQRVAATFEHAGLVKRDDAWYSDNWDSARHKLRIRAETWFGSIDVRRNAP